MSSQTLDQLFQTSCSAFSSVHLTSPHLTSRACGVFVCGERERERERERGCGGGVDFMCVNSDDGGDMEKLLVRAGLLDCCLHTRFKVL